MISLLTFEVCFAHTVQVKTAFVNLHHVAVETFPFVRHPRVDIKG
jgi:hypothetical protein